MDKSSTFSKSSNIIREPLPVLLQKELEQITQTLEFEKRESTYLDEQIKLLQYEISSVPRIPSSSLRCLRSQIQIKSKQLELEISSLNRNKYKNKELRSQINDYRLDKCAHKQSLMAITDNLEKTSRAAEDRSQEIEKTSAQKSQQQERIFYLRAKSANQRNNFDERISTLTSMLRNTGMDSRIDYQEKQYAAQSIEVISVLKAIAKGFGKKTVENKRELDHYMKYMQSLKTGFKHIKAVTGIVDIDDVVTSCVKSEEQNRLVLFYLNSLNAEIDVIQERLEANNEKIRVLEVNKMNGQNCVKELKIVNSKKLGKIQKKIQMDLEEINKQSKIFDKVLPVLKKLLQVTKKISFRPVNCEVVCEINGEKLNLENCSAVLMNIEEFILFLNMVIELKVKKELTVHTSPPKRRLEDDRMIVKDIIDEKDLYDEPGLEEVRVPVSLEDMRNKAIMIFNKRKSVFKTKAHTPESLVSRTPTSRNH